MWQLKISGFVKQFLWKDCQDVLQPKRSMFKKSVVQDDLCPICIREEESMIHVLWSCSSASNIWGFETTKMRKWPNCFPSFWCLWKHMVDSLDQNELAMNDVILIQLWARRNMVIFEKMFESPQISCKKGQITDGELPYGTTT